jgi:hypothetical protein
LTCGLFIFLVTIAAYRAHVVVVVRLGACLIGCILGCILGDVFFLCQ